jgi:hypothetical protein
MAISVINEIQRDLPVRANFVVNSNTYYAL